MSSTCTQLASATDVLQLRLMHSVKQSLYVRPSVLTSIWVSWLNVKPKWLTYPSG